MKFKVNENWRLVESDDDVEIYLYATNDGRFFYYDGSQLIELSKGKAGKVIRKIEGWKNTEDKIEDKLKGGEPGSDDEPGSIGEPGSNGEPNVGGAGSSESDSDYETFDFDEEEFELDGVDVDFNPEQWKKDIFNSETTIINKEIRDTKARRRAITKPNEAVVSAIKKDFHDFITRRVKEYEAEVEKWSTGVRVFDDDQAEKRIKYREVEGLKKPSVYIYLDSSGSAQGTDTVKVIEQCASAFQSFVKKGLLDVEWYYFGTRVSKLTSPSTAAIEKSDEEEIERVAKARQTAGNSTNWGPLFNHIQGNGQTALEMTDYDMPWYEISDSDIIYDEKVHAKPDNIVIVTDGDLDGQIKEDIKVDGAIWAIFVNNETDAIKNHAVCKHYRHWRINMPKTSSKDKEDIHI